MTSPPSDTFHIDIPTWQLHQVLGITPRQRIKYCHLLASHHICGYQFKWQKGQNFWTPQQVKALLFVRSLFHPPQGGRRYQAEVLQILDRGLPL